jgi:hypothetical protein
MLSPDMVCFLLRLCGDMPCAGGVESRRRREAIVCAAALCLGALAIVHSLPALQPRQNCTQTRHRLKHGRLCCIPSQYRRAGMMPSRPANRKRAVLPPRVAAACRYALELRPLGPGARATITPGGTGSEIVVGRRTGGPPP